MTIPIHCPKCGRFKPAPDQWAGKLVACDDCGAQFKVPTKRAKPTKKPESEPRAAAARATLPPEESHERPAGTVVAECEACGRQYHVPSDWAGRRCRCLYCGTVVEVAYPLTDADVSAPPEPSDPQPGGTSQRGCPEHAGRREGKTQEERGQ